MAPHPDFPYWLACARFPKFGPARLSKLAAHFPSMEDAFSAAEDQLVRAGIEPAIARAFACERHRIDPAREADRVEREGLHVIICRDDAYPPTLRDLYAPPALLFVRGRLPDPMRPTLAVVGSRKNTRYGERAMRALVEPAAGSGMTIVSGLAIGTDALAHRAALSAGAPTIAVLGSGTDRASLTPSRHAGLADEIIARGGAIVSEFPPGTPGYKQNFPIRNRMIAALAQATLIVEAAERSGSLITARAALELGRDVLAVPGPFDAPTSAGTNGLIKMGATPATELQDVLDAFHLKADARVSAYAPANPAERAVCEALGSDPVHVDELARTLTLPAPELMSTLTILEMHGAARHVGGRYYVRG